MIHNFEPETRGAIFNEIARMLGIDGQNAVRDPNDRVVAIDLRYLDIQSNREDQVSDFKENEITAHGIDGIMGMIEKATLRDARVRYGEAAYVIYFHLAGGQMNRGRFTFIVPGGAHELRGPGGSTAMTTRGHGGMTAYSAFGTGMPGEVTPMEVMRILPELLRWATDERRLNDERTQLIFQSAERLIQRQNEIIEHHDARGMSVRQLENDLFDLKDEREKKRKEDEDKKKWIEGAFKALKNYGPYALPPIIEAIRKLNHGPNYVPKEIDIEAIQERIRQAEAEAEAKANGTAPPQAANGAAATNGKPQPSQPAAAAAEGNGDPGAQRAQIEQLSMRIAYDLCRLVALLKARGHIDLVREKLDGSAAQGLFDQMVTATDNFAPESEQKVDSLVAMALGFGQALREAPMIAMGLMQSVEGFERAGFMELADLLKHYAVLTGLETA